MLTGNGPSTAHGVRGLDLLGRGAAGYASTTSTREIPMHSYLRTVLSAASTRYLPALLVPALLTASTAAHAALLDISNGFFTGHSTTTVGFDFDFVLEGTLTHNGVAHSTSIELSCVVDNVAHDVDCDGVLTLGSATIGIGCAFDGATDDAEWTIDSGASAGQSSAHHEWGKDLLAEFIPVREEVLIDENGFYYYSGVKTTFDEIDQIDWNLGKWNGLFPRKP